MSAKLTGRLAGSVNYYNLTLGENEKDWSHLSNTDSFTPAPKTRVFIDWRRYFDKKIFPGDKILPASQCPQTQLKPSRYLLEKDRREEPDSSSQSGIEGLFWTKFFQYQCH